MEMKFDSDYNGQIHAQIHFMLKIVYEYNNSKDK